MKIAIPLAIALTIAMPAFAQQGSAAAGSAGTAAVGGNSASTLGAGAVSKSPGGDTSALGMGASAGGDNTKTRAGVHGNNNLNGNAMAMAHEGGDMAKSHTVCHDRSDSVDCRTKTMAHEPGGPPVKSTSEGEAAIPQQ
jgi:PAB1-binding protein PBP1